MVLAVRSLRQCRIYIRSLPLPEPPATMREIAEALSRHRKRPLDLMSWPLPPRLPAGWLIRTGRSDHIVYDAHSTPLHAEQIIGHEIGHLLLHEPTEPREPAAPDDIVAQLLGGGRPTTTRAQSGHRSLDRNARRRENEAELFGRALIEFLHPERVPLRDADLALIDLSRVACAA